MKNFILGKEYVVEEIRKAKSQNGLPLSSYSFFTFGIGIGGEFLVIENGYGKRVSFMLSCVTGIGHFYVCVYNDFMTPTTYYNRD